MVPFVAMLVNTEDDTIVDFHRRSTMDGLKRVWNKQMSRMRLGGIESTKDEFEKIDDEEKQPFEKMTPLMLKIILMIVLIFHTM